MAKAQLLAIFYAGGAGGGRGEGGGGEGGGTGGGGGRGEREGGKAEGVRRPGGYFDSRTLHTGECLRLWALGSVCRFSIIPLRLVSPQKGTGYISSYVELASQIYDYKLLLTLLNVLITLN